MGRVIAPLVALAAAGWVALLISAPILPGSISAVLYGLGSFICHQIPERSFHIAGFQLPVCARCLGLYAGAACGIGCGVWPARAVQAVRAFDAPTTRWLAGVAAAPTVITLVLEWAGLWDPSNVTRAIAGVPFGAVIGLVVMSALPTLHYGECVPPRPTVSKPPPPPI